jgi:hypothetical protein
LNTLFLLLKSKACCPFFCFICKELTSLRSQYPHKFFFFFTKLSHTASFYWQDNKQNQKVCLCSVKNNSKCKNVFTISASLPSNTADVLDYFINLCRASDACLARILYQCMTNLHRCNLIIFEYGSCKTNC